MSERSPDAVKVLPLVQLVREAVDASGLTLRDFARERGVKYGTLRRYYDKKMPPLQQGLKPDTEKALALALDLPLSTIHRAAEESHARALYRVELGDSTTISWISDTRLSEEEKRKKAAELYEQIKDLLD